MASTPQRVIERLNAEIPAKISLNQFCKKTGINPNSVDKYRAGVTEPTQTSLEKLSAYFEVSAAWLRGDYEWSLEDEVIRCKIDVARQGIADDERAMEQELLDIFHNSVPQGYKRIFVDRADEIASQLIGEKDNFIQGKLKKATH